MTICGVTVGKCKRKDPCLTVAPIKGNCPFFTPEAVNKLVNKSMFQNVAVSMSFDTVAVHELLLCDADRLPTCFNGW